MTTITSRHHPIVKTFRDAARGGTVMLLDGWHLLSEAITAEVAIDTLAVSTAVTPDEHALVARVHASGATVVAVSAAVLKLLSPVETPTGAVAIAQRPGVAHATLITPPPALVVVGLGIQDPGNAGAIIRAAAAAGATGVLLDDTTADPWGWKALRAAMGSTFHIPVVRSRSPVAVLTGWRSDQIAIVAAVPRGGTTMSDLDLTRPLVLLMGGEGAGLPAEALAATDQRISIPMSGAIESLNVAVATAVLLYEARRQRAPGAPKPFGEGGQ